MKHPVSLALGIIAVAMAVAALVVSLIAISDNDTARPADALASASRLHQPGVYTKAFVEQAIERYDSEGRGGAISYYNTKESMSGDWYVFIIDEAGKIVSHAARPERIGLSLDNLVDVTGYSYGLDFADTTENGSWVKYAYLNPANGHYENKHSWVVKRDGLIFGSGWYERSTDSLLPSKTEEPEAYTKAFVERALRRYTAQGRDATFSYYNSMESVDGDWYLFIIDENDKMVVHATVPDNIGQDMKGPLGTDSTGYDFGSEMLTATEDGKWVSYVYINPARGQEGKKHSWVVKRDGLIFASGWYETSTDAPTDAPTDALPPPRTQEPGEYTKSFVEQAVRRYAAQGRDATFSYYNSMESVDGDWYLFIIDENDKMVVHATVPDNIGQDMKGPLGTDSAGYDFGSEMLTATEDGKWVSYVYINPARGQEGKKHSWVVRRDGLIFGSGWYERSTDSSPPARTQEPGAYTKSFVEQGLRRYTSEGRDAAFSYYNSMESVDGQWYLFVFEDGKLVVHATVPENIGADLRGPLGTDSAGYDFGSEMLTATEDGKWVSYVYINPVSGQEGKKHSWVVRRDGLIFGSGWYEMPTDASPPSRTHELGEYTKYFVQQAVRRYTSEGRDAAFSYYNSMESVDGDWYIFVVDEDDKLAVHATVPENIGQDLRGPLGTDSAGYDFGSEMLTATEDGKWVSYVYINPSSGQEGKKHSWVVRRDGLIFGSGWYEN